MRVKIGNTWYDAAETPICIQFEDVEIEGVKGMTKDGAPNNRFIAFTESDGLTADVIRQWVRDQIEIPSQS